ncbi:right-handed parallel beta-helix repeat-containing protein [Bacteroidota bacterium]
MKWYYFFIPFIVPAFFISAQTTLNVPSDYSSIQEALSNADSGATVLVQAGTYYENLIWPATKAIKLRSGDSATNTIINGSDFSSVITINSIADSNTIISGFTITGGDNVNYGGGILLIETILQIQDCLISNNSAKKSGGGIYCQNAELFIEHTKFINNKTTDSDYHDGGGAIYAKSSQIIIDSVDMSENYSAYQGGAFFFDGENTNVNIMESLIYRNQADEDGGGIAMENFPIVSVSKSSFVNNIAGDKGGGILLLQGELIPDKIKFIGNRAEKGGGIYTFSGGTLAETDSGNIIFFDNIAEKGAALYVESNISTNSLEFYSNKSDFEGSVIYLFTERNLELSNCIFWNNTGHSMLFKEDNCNMSINNSIFQNNGLAIKNDDNINYVEATNNYWGDLIGPYHPIQNPSGIGDTVSNYVNIIPFLTSPSLDLPPLPIQNLHFGTDANSSTLYWDESPLTDVIGYKIHYSNLIGYPYENSIDVGNTTEYSISGLPYSIYLTVTCYDVDGNESWYSEELEFESPMGANETYIIPSAYTLYQNYPNPFNPSTKIQYALPQQSKVIINIYNVLGERITELLNDIKPAGYHEVEFKANNLPSGIYLYQINAGDYTETKKMILLK